MRRFYDEPPSPGMSNVSYAAWKEPTKQKPRRSGVCLGAGMGYERTLERITYALHTLHRVYAASIVESVIVAATPIM